MKEQQELEMLNALKEIADYVAIKENKHPDGLDALSLIHSYIVVNEWKRLGYTEEEAEELYEESQIYI